MGFIWKLVLFSKDDSIAGSISFSLDCWLTCACCEGIGNLDNVLGSQLFSSEMAIVVNRYGGECSRIFNTLGLGIL